MTDTQTWPDDIAELIEDFAFLDGWEERYMHVIDLGKAMEPLPDVARNPANKVQGCASQVWLTSDRDSDGQLVFRGDSDAHIVRGLVAIATQVFSHKPDAVIRELDHEALFGELGLSEHLSSQRANGIAQHGRPHQARGRGIGRLNQEKMSAIWLLSAPSLTTRSSR